MRINTDTREAVKIDEKDLEDVVTFIYLGGIIATKGGADKDINNRLGKSQITIWNAQENLELVKVFHSN